MDITKAIGDTDTLIDTYLGGSWSIEQLLELRRELAVQLYYLSSHVKRAHGEAGVAYIRRRYNIAHQITEAIRKDSKLSQNKAEAAAEASQEARDDREAEVWAEAEREALRTKIDGIKAVLASMQQEIANAAHEKRTTHVQESHTT